MGISGESSVLKQRRCSCLIQYRWQMPLQECTKQWSLNAETRSFACNILDLIEICLLVLCNVEGAIQIASQSE